MKNLVFTTAAALAFFVASPADAKTTEHSHWGGAQENHFKSNEVFCPGCYVSHAKVLYHKDDHHMPILVHTDHHGNVRYLAPFYQGNDAVHMYGQSWGSISHDKIRHFYAHRKLDKALDDSIGSPMERVPGAREVHAPR